MSEEEDEKQQYEFDQPFQNKIAALMLRDPKFAVANSELIDPEYFTEAHVGQLVTVLKEYVQTYKSSPDKSVLATVLKNAIAKKLIRPDQKSDVIALVKDSYKVDLSASAYVAKNVREFAKHQAMEQAIMRSVSLLDKGNYEEIEKEMRAAVRVGEITGGQDYDYFAEIESRTKRREDILAGRIVKTGITTGYAAIDGCMYHGGWGRQELSCVMGAAKAGKSMALGDFSQNAAMAGKNVFYGSCELAAWIIAERLDAAIADVKISDVHKDPDAVRRAVDAAAAKAKSNLKMRDFASGTLKPAELHRIIESYHSDGIIFDLITIDYADIMAANYRADSLRDNLREIYIDLRAIAHEFNVAMLTATQTNRDGAKTSVSQATDIGDDWNKARTLDLLIGINSTDAERAAGTARLRWLLSRNTEDGFTIEVRQEREKMKFISKVIGRI